MRIFFAITALMMLFASTEAILKLKKLAGAALLGVAIAPRFVPIPIPHHVHHKESHGWHQESHGWDHGHGGHGHGHKDLFTVHKGGWQHYGGIHDASSSGHGHGHGWW